MGLGKSRQSVVAACLAAGEGRVLILCPASLRINWEREIRMVYPDAVVGMAGEDRIEALYGCQWVIANYERLGGLVRETKLDFEVMAVDEAHYLKEHQAAASPLVSVRPIQSRIARSDRTTWFLDGHRTRHPQGILVAPETGAQGEVGADREAGRLFI